MSEQFSNPQQALIERLRRAPQPELSTEIRAAILGRMLDALEHPPLPAPRPRLLQPVAVFAIVLIVGALIAGGVLFVLSRQNQTELLPTATGEPTLSPSPTVTITPTPTASPTVTIEPTTVVPAVVSSPVLIETLPPTLTPTATDQVTLSPIVPPTASGNTVIVVEGPVQAINVNIITIYNIQIQIDPNNPILKTISIGDNLRVEGNTVSGTPQITVIAVTVVVVNVTINNGGGGNSGDGNPPPSGSGEVWTDDGTCANPPPDWAPANGWRRRCQGQQGNNNNGNGNGNNNSNGNNNGNGNGSGDKPNKNDH